MGEQLGEGEKGDKPGIERASEVEVRERRSVVVRRGDLETGREDMVRLGAGRQCAGMKVEEVWEMESKRKMWEW
jgi:hypothetical protein